MRDIMCGPASPEFCNVPSVAEAAQGVPSLQRDIPFLRTEGATEADLVRRSHLIEAGAMDLTPQETVHALRVIKRAHDHRLSRTKAIGQRIRKEAAQREDVGVQKSPWRALASVHDDVIKRGFLENTFRLHDGSMEIHEASDPTAFHYTLKHLEAMMRRQAKHLLASPLQSAGDFHAKLQVLFDTRLLQTQDADLATQVANSLVQDVTAFIGPPGLQGATGDAHRPQVAPSNLKQPFKNC
jgi:hypothetical protein